MSETNRTIEVLSQQELGRLSDSPPILAPIEGDLGRVKLASSTLAIPSESGKETATITKLSTYSDLCVVGYYYGPSPCFKINQESLRTFLEGDRSVSERGGQDNVSVLLSTRLPSYNIAQLSNNRDVIVSVYAMADLSPEDAVAIVGHERGHAYYFHEKQRPGLIDMLKTPDMVRKQEVVAAIRGQEFAADCWAGRRKGLGALRVIHALVNASALAAKEMGQIVYDGDWTHPGLLDRANHIRSCVQEVSSSAP